MTNIEVLLVIIIVLLVLIGSRGSATGPRWRGPTAEEEARWAEELERQYPPIPMTAEAKAWWDEELKRSRGSSSERRTSS